MKDGQTLHILGRNDYPGIAFLRETFLLAGSCGDVHKKLKARPTWSFITVSER